MEGGFLVRLLLVLSIVFTDKIGAYPANKIIGDMFFIRLCKIYFLLDENKFEKNDMCSAVYLCNHSGIAHPQWRDHTNFWEAGIVLKQI
mgnify:CR=1 FL=1